jgi:hypothetical protein
MSKRNVYIKTRTAGDCFGTYAVIKSARTNRTLAVTETRPYGFTVAAIKDAHTIAAARGYAVVGES